MKVVANIATQETRISSLKATLDSVIDQFDEINIYLNNFSSVPNFLRHEKINTCIGSDLADNGKFFFVRKYKPGDVYFTLDDDIIYPKDYSVQTLGNLQTHKNCVVTYHGRKLSGMGVPYYTGHKKQFLFSGVIHNDQEIDVAGTGCSAFVLTEDFYPVLLYGHVTTKMSDLIFSLECAKRAVKIMACRHDFGWLRPFNRIQHGIQHEFMNKETPLQNRFADEIYRIKYGN